MKSFKEMLSEGRFDLKDNPKRKDFCENMRKEVTDLFNKNVTWRPAEVNKDLDSHFIYSENNKALMQIWYSGKEQMDNEWIVTLMIYKNIDTNKYNIYTINREKTPMFRKLINVDISKASKAIEKFDKDMKIMYPDRHE